VRQSRCACEGTDRQNAPPGFVRLTWQRAPHLANARRCRANPESRFRRFNSSPEVIHLVVLTYVRFPLSLPNVEDVLFERRIEVYHQSLHQILTDSDADCRAERPPYSA
jgi:hypothetical protein